MTSNATNKKKCSFVALHFLEKINAVKITVHRNENNNIFLSIDIIRLKNILKGT